MPKHAVHLDDIHEAMSIRYNNTVYEKQQAGEDVIVLSLGEAFFDIPLFSFEDLPYPDIYHYSHSRGILPLRKQLASYYSEEYGVPVDPATEIIVTAGSKIAIHMALMTILNPRDEVLIHEPAWVSYTEQVKLCHGVPVPIPVDATVDEYEDYVTDRTRVIIVNSPHNPRGKVLDHSDWTELHRLAERRDLFILSDEAYSDFLLDRGDFVSAAALDPAKTHTIVCNSMSKNYGMSGWRIGYLIAREDILYQILKVNQHLVTCPATILELYLARHFRTILEITYPQIQAVVEKRSRIAALLDRLGMTCLPGEGTFYLFVSIAGSGMGSEEFCTTLLEEGGVSVVPGVGYGRSCDGYIRVSIGTEPMDRTVEGVMRIAELAGVEGTVREEAYKEFAERVVTT
jgi:aminotransferase